MWWNVFNATDPMFKRWIGQIKAIDEIDAAKLVAKVTGVSIRHIVIEPR